MPNWMWFVLGAGGGYLIARHAKAGIKANLAFNLGAGRGFNLSGAGETQLDQPDGSEPFRQQGGWNPLTPGEFPELVNPDDGRIIDHPWRSGGGLLT